MKPRFWICLILSALLASCAHGGGKPALTFNAAVPEGWKEIPNRRHHDVHDQGRRLQAVRAHPGAPLAEPFQFTKKTMQPGMLPEAAAEIIVNEILADSNIRNFSVTENIPAHIAGNRGFRLAFVYTDADGYFFKTVYYGFIKGDSFYNIRYGATRKSIFKRI